MKTTFQFLRLFEYGVILNGSQTCVAFKSVCALFEYGVILNGSQTARNVQRCLIRFEYGVILNGSQTGLGKGKSKSGLSMVLF